MSVAVNPMTTRDRLAAASLVLLLFPAVNPGVNISLGDVILGATILASLSRWQNSPRPIPAMALGISLMVGVALSVSGFRSAETDLVEGLQLVLILGLLVPFAGTVWNRVSERRVANLLTIGLAVNGAIAVLQVTSQGLRLPSQPAFGVGEFGLRPLGLMGNPNGLGLVAVWCLPFALASVQGARSRIAACGWGLALIAGVAGGLVSLSKAAWLALPVAAWLSVIAVWPRAALRGMVVLILGFSAVGLSVAKTPWIKAAMEYRMLSSDSVGSRTDAIVGAFDNVMRWVVVGLGPGADAQLGWGEARIHNWIVSMAVQYGGPAVVSLIALKTVLLVMALRFVSVRSARVAIVAFLLAEVSMLGHPLYLTRAHWVPMFVLVSLVARRVGSANGPSAGESACVV